MTERAHDLSATADRQIAGLIELLSRLDQSALGRPCPSREKLGDGTIGAAARHTAANYQRIAAFVRASDRMAGTHQGAHSPRHQAGEPHGTSYTARDIDVDAMVVALGATRDALGRIAELTDGQLDEVPPKDSFRFCDGQRTLEQVLAALLKHQAHQLEAIGA